MVFGSYGMYAVGAPMLEGGEMRVGLIGYLCSGVQAGGRRRTFMVGIERGLML